MISETPNGDFGGNGEFTINFPELVLSSRVFWRKTGQTFRRYLDEVAFNSERHGFWNHDRNRSSFKVASMLELLIRWLQVLPGDGVVMERAVTPKYTNKTAFIHSMKPSTPRMITSNRNYITIGWEDCDSIILGEKPKWYVLEKKDRVLGWCRVYMGFKTQTDVGPFGPNDYYEFRLKVTNGKEDSEWSDPLFAVTRDDVVSVAHLHRVVENGPVPTLRRVLNQRPSAVDIPNRFQQTPLRVAALRNNTTFMGIILNHGADIENRELGSGRTPLMTAAQMGHLEAVQLLLEKGASWATRDRNGLTALNYAVDNSHIEVVRLGAENGASVTDTDKFGWSPLMRGVTLKSSLEVLTYLLENGSDPNDADDREQTVLMQAVLSGRPEVVELLLSKGADIERKNIYGHSAYDLAKSSTKEGILKTAHLLGNEPEEDSKKRPKFRKKIK